MQKLRVILAGVFISLLSVSSVFADIGIKTNGTSHNAITNLNFTTPTGSSILTETGLTRTIPAVDKNLFATGVATGGATSVVSTTAAVPTGFSYVRKVIPTNSDAAFTAGTLANGKPSQLLTIFVAGVSPGNGTGSYTITPTTSTGFTSVVLTTVKDVVRLMYIDDTAGWVLLGFDGVVTINLKN